MVIFVEEKNRIFCKNENGEVVAEVTFPNVDEITIEINHTFVDDSLRGQGIAGQLLEAAAAKAKRENKKVIPTCSYAVKWFDKNDKYSNLLMK